MVFRSVNTKLFYCSQHRLFFEGLIFALGIHATFLRRNSVVSSINIPANCTIMNCACHALAYEGTQGVPEDKKGEDAQVHADENRLKIMIGLKGSS